MHRHDQDEDQSKSFRKEVAKGPMREQGNVDLQACSSPKLSQVVG